MKVVYTQYFRFFGKHFCNLLFSMISYSSLDTSDVSDSWTLIEINLRIKIMTLKMLFLKHSKLKRMSIIN